MVRSHEMPQPSDDEFEAASDWQRERREETYANGRGANPEMTRRTFNDSYSGSDADAMFGKEERRSPGGSRSGLRSDGKAHAERDEDTWAHDRTFSDDEVRTNGRSLETEAIINGTRDSDKQRRARAALERLQRDRGGRLLG